MEKIERISEVIFKKTVKTLIESDYFEMFLDGASSEVDEYSRCSDEERDLVWDKIFEKQANFLKKLD